MLSDGIDPTKSHRRSILDSVVMEDIDELIDNGGFLPSFVNAKISDGGGFSFSMLSSPNYRNLKVLTCNVRLTSRLLQEAIRNEPRKDLPR
jgi:hypothetical protein